MDGLRSHIQKLERLLHHVSKHLVFSTPFSVFGYPDETLFLVFDILHNNYKSLSHRLQQSK